MPGVSSDALPDVARTLIRQHIDSVGRLDLLLILYGDPRVRWSAARMSRQMHTSARWAEGQMEALAAAGILGRATVEGEAGWAYDPADDATAEAVQELVNACRLDWPSVTREVMSLRPTGAQAFSDAFRLRRRDG